MMEEESLGLPYDTEYQKKGAGFFFGGGGCIVCVALSCLYSHVIILESRFFTDNGLICRRACSL